MLPIVGVALLWLAAFGGAPLVGMALHDRLAAAGYLHAEAIGWTAGLTLFLMLPLAYLFFPIGFGDASTRRATRRQLLMQVLNGFYLVTALFGDGIYIPAADPDAPTKPWIMKIFMLLVLIVTGILVWLAFYG